MTLITIDELRDRIRSSLVLTALAKATGENVAVANVASMLRREFRCKATVLDLFAVIREIRKEGEIDDD